MNIKKTPLSALRINDDNPRIIKDHKFQIDWGNGIDSESDGLSAKSKEKKPEVCPHCGKEI